MDQQKPKKKNLKSWIMAIRPPTLLAGLGPVLLGIAFAWQNRDGEMAAGPLVFASLAAVLLVLLLQSAANLVNDAKDAEKGIDSGERLGPPRVVQAGLLPLAAVKKGYYLCFAAAAAIAGLLFTQVGDLLVLEMAALCALAAYAYTAGPFPLAYFALGEALALLFFGPIAVMGTNYLHTHQIDPLIAVWGIGPGLISAAIMGINNYRDRRGDAAAGKHTLATLLGENWGRRLPLLFLSLSIIWLFAFGYVQNRTVLAAILALLASGLVFYGIRPLMVSKLPADHNRALKRTALFNFAYALGFVILVSL